MHSHTQWISSPPSTSSLPAGRLRARGTGASDLEENTLDEGVVGHRRLHQTFLGGFGHFARSWLYTWFIPKEPGQGCIVIAWVEG
jgi:hypothetical protein